MIMMMMMIVMMMMMMIIIIIITIITDSFRCYFSSLVEQIAHYKAKNQNTVKTNSYGKKSKATIDARNNKTTTTTTTTTTTQREQQLEIATGLRKTDIIPYSFYNSPPPRNDKCPCSVRSV